jgi:hypothetical protein
MRLTARWLLALLPLLLGSGVTLAAPAPPVGPTLATAHAGTIVVPNTKEMNFTGCTVGNGGTIANVNCTGSGGTVTSVGATVPLVSTGGTTPVLSLNYGGQLGLSVNTLVLLATAVTPNSYGSTTAVGTFTVNAEGQLTAAANATIASTTINTSSPLGGGGSVAPGGSLTLTCSTCLVSGGTVDATGFNPLAADPGGPSANTIWYNTTTNRFKLYNGTGASVLGDGSLQLATNYPATQHFDIISTGAATANIDVTGIAALNIATASTATLHTTIGTAVGAGTVFKMYGDELDLFFGQVGSPGGFDAFCLFCSAGGTQEQLFGLYGTVAHPWILFGDTSHYLTVKIQPYAEWGTPAGAHDFVFDGQPPGNNINIMVDTPPASTAGASLTITAQAAAVGSGLNGGVLVLHGGAKDGAGVNGGVTAASTAGEPFSSGNSTGMSTQDCATCNYNDDSSTVTFKGATIGLGTTGGTNTVKGLTTFQQQTTQTGNIIYGGTTTSAFNPTTGAMYALGTTALPWYNLHVGGAGANGLIVHDDLTNTNYGSLFYNGANFELQNVGAGYLLEVSPSHVILEPGSGAFGVLSAGSTGGLAYIEDFAGDRLVLVTTSGGSGTLDLGIAALTTHTHGNWTADLAQGYKVGNAIAAAATVAPTAAVTHITGHAAAISTITAPAYIATAGAGGILTLVFDDAAASWTTGGNVALAGNPTKAGQAVRFVYDNATSLWYPPWQPSSEANFSAYKVKPSSGTSTGVLSQTTVTNASTITRGDVTVNQSGIVSTSNAIFDLCSDGGTCASPYVTCSVPCGGSFGAITNCTVSTSAVPAGTVLTWSENTTGCSTDPGVNINVHYTTP